MANEKKTINVSEQLLISALIGFGISILILIISHFLPINWMIMYDNFTGFADSTVGKASYNCSLGRTHFHDFTGLNISVGNQSRNFAMIIGDSFDGHGVFILGTTLVLTLLIYFFKKVDVNIVND